MRTPRWSVLAALVLVGLLSTPARAQWVEGGTQIASNVLPLGLIAVPDAQAGVLVRTLEPGGAVTRVGPDGRFPAGWPSSSVQSSFNVMGLAADGVGGAFVGERRSGSSSNQLVVHHLFSNGSMDPGWPAGGCVVAEVGAGSLLYLAADGAGGAYAAWNTFSVDSSQLFVLRIDPSGAASTGWPASGVRIARSGEIIQFGDVQATPAGLYLTGDLSNSIVGGAIHDAFVGHVSPTGSIPAGWGTGTVVLPYLPNGSDPPPYAIDTAGGIFYSWIYSPVGRLVHLLADASPDPAWPVRGLALLADTTHYQFLYNPVSDGAGGCFARFAYDSAATNQIVVPRLVHVTASATPEPGWPLLGARLPYVFNGYGYGDIVPDGNGGAYATWFEDPFSSGFHTLRVHHVAFGGVTAPYWPETGLTLASGPGLRFASSAQMVTDTHGGAIVLWQDSRTAAADTVDILALGFGPDGSFTTSVGGRLPAFSGGLHASPVPARDVTNLAFSLARTTSVRVEVLDVNGRRIRRLVAGTLAPGPHSVAWDGRDDAGRSVAPGVYMARAEGSGVTSAARMVRIR